VPDERHQLGVQVELPNRDEIDNADGDAFTKKRGALGDESFPRLGAILVRRADELNCRDQLPFTLDIEDADLVLVFVGRLCLDRGSEVDARLGNETSRQLIPQLLHDARRPHGVKSLPRRFLAHR
jgi:hypothetical protein